MRADIHTLAGVYVADALPDDEREAFETHVARCESCAQELRGLRETAAHLGVAASSPAPAWLKPRVMAQIGQVRQLPPVMETPVVLRPRRPWLPRLTTGLAVAGLAAAAVFGVVAIRAGDVLDQERARQAQVASVLAAPDAETVREGSAIAVVARSQGRMVFLAGGLPALPENRTYQLWTIGPDGHPASAGLLKPDAAGRTEPVVRRLGPAEQVAVTVEPAGGSRRPTTKPVVVLELPA